ncbi:secreted RxLR effector protein 161-like [Leptopilina heterotoma]|uniref:secreted RxLR effector protein 161-like n=1 Tax=Leptopilina heterotoma TaxID=63436 RepID=UPI001CA7B881|nr:secreted RxLR effector protein 161-like [Leptopilina heterotoma]
MTDCNAVSTPLDIGTKLVKGNAWEDSDGEKPPYRELVGCILYLSISTRPDISHAASVLGQFNNCFNRTHWNAAKRVLRYLKGTSDLGILYTHERSDLAGYVDADWAGSTHDRRSFTGFAFILSGGAIVWDSRKQRNVALSTTEAEYMAMAEAAKEVVHLRHFLVELGLNDVNSITLFVDNI